MNDIIFSSIPELLWTRTICEALLRLVRRLLPPIINCDSNRNDNEVLF